MERKEFDAKLTSFREVTNTSTQLARLLAEASIVHFDKHGDTSYCQDFYDAMIKNYNRKSAYLKWLVEHTAIMLENGKFKKDKGENATPYQDAGLIAKALSVPFWEFNPETSVKNFSSQDIIKAVISVVSKFENAKRYKPVDAKASEELQIVKDMVSSLVPETNGDNGTTEPDLSATGQKAPDRSLAA